ncbi:MAG: hypothetical protein PHC52_00480 [Syntrophales bacterium]|nr:hypothetical protein [Syntrophales bacterium]
MNKLKAIWNWIKLAWTWWTANREEIEDVAEDVGDFLGIEIGDHDQLTICAECYKAGFPVPALQVKKVIIGEGKAALTFLVADCALHEEPDWIDQKREDWRKIHGGGSNE